MTVQARHSFRFAEFEVREEELRATRSGQPLAIEPKAFRVLLYLLHHAGHLVAKDEIVSAVWGDTAVTDNSLARAVALLRRVLEDDPHQPRFIETVSTIGYRFICPVANEDVALEVAAAGGGAAHGARARAEPLVTPAGAHRRMGWIAIGAGVMLAAAMVLFFYARKERHISPTVRTIRSIAVLPLANLSNDPQQEFFADGMTEQLITELVQLNACDVISRTSVMRYKETRLPTRDIARELSADAIVEGSVLRSGTRVRITAQLIDAANDRHLWSASFEREIGDVIALQGDVARSIARQLNLTINQAERPGRRRPQKVAPEAYDAYLWGWYFFNHWQFAKAATAFDQATRADPAFALAYALLFEADGMVSFLQDRPLSERALAAMRRALELDENLAEAHDAAGDVRMTMKDWAGAEAEFRQAVELDPGSIDAIIHYLNYLQQTTRWQEAEVEAKRALRLDPVSPYTNLCMLHLFVNTHRFEQAEAQFRRVLELDPENATAYARIVTVYAAQNREEEAATAFLQAETLGGASAEQSSALAAAQKEGGFQGIVKRRIEQLQQEAQHRRVPPVDFARLYALLGDKEQAFKFLEEAYGQHAGRLIWLKADAIWDPLRADPRFQSLVERMRFPEG